MSTTIQKIGYAMMRDPIFNEIKKYQHEFWGTKPIPSTRLMGDIGYVLGQNFEVVALEERIFIFNEVEKAMQSSDELLSTAVATGFLEAIDSVSAEIPHLQKKIFQELGPASKAYLLDWWKWLGISPDI